MLSIPQLIRMSE
jgi:origin recognition complex subunit 4